MRQQQQNTLGKLLTVLFVFFVLPISIFVVQYARQVQGASSAVSYPIYEGSLAPGWQNWSWMSQVNLANPSPAYAGTTSIAFTPFQIGAGLYLHTNRAVNISPYTFLHFAAQASRAGQAYDVMLYGAANHRLSQVHLAHYGGDPVVSRWKVYNIPLADLRANATQISGVAFQSRTRRRGTLYLASISFTSSTTSPTPTPTLTATADPTATATATADPPTATATSTADPTADPTATATSTADPTADPTATATATADPTGLVLTPLDSTLIANWKPSTDPTVKWQVASVWTGDGNPANGSQLISSKILAPTASAADMNGLRTGDTYTVKLQTISTSGVLTDAMSATGTTDPQSPMANAAFFENFDATPAGGDLDYNYFDVRTNDRLRPGDIHLDKTQVFANERHFHTQLIGGEGQGAALIRPRVPFDFTNRTGTIQFEVDTPGDMRFAGKWWEVDVTKDIAGSQEGFGDTGQFTDSVTFGFMRDSDPNNGDQALYGCMQNNPGKEGYCLNQPAIIVNIGGVQHEFRAPFDITKTFMSPPNVRMPVVIKLSQTSAEMFLNGVSVVKASGFTLPFTKGNVLFAHRATYGTKISNNVTWPQFPALGLQLLHWDTIQYDGPAGSINPVVKTYVQPKCGTVVHYSNDDKVIDNCPGVAPGGTVTLTIPDDLSQANHARLVFNNELGTGSGTVSINGHSMPFVVTNHCDVTAQVPDCLQTDYADDIPVSWLRTGSNTVQFSYSDPATQFNQVELEVIFNQQRVLGNPPLDPVPQIGVTTQTFREERITTDPMQLTGTTYIYSGGTAAPVTYNASVITPDSTWLKITSPATGTLVSPALGGHLVPLSFSVDYTQLNPITSQDGDVGVIEITGGIMPMYVAVIRQYFGQNFRHVTVSTFPVNSVFNKSAIPDYHGSSNNGN